MRIHRGPAAVIGDESHRSHSRFECVVLDVHTLADGEGVASRKIRKPEDLPVVVDCWWCALGCWGAWITAGMGPVGGETSRQRSMSPAKTICDPGFPHAWGTGFSFLPGEATWLSLGPGKGRVVLWFGGTVLADSD